MLFRLQTHSECVKGSFKDSDCTILQFGAAGEFRYNFIFPLRFKKQASTFETRICWREKKFFNEQKYNKNFQSY
jgi:hypothetical protein